MRKGFIFDLNKCTGCNACQIACSIENEVELPYNWRQVNTFNPSKHPDLFYLHLSSACHHCLEPPCLIHCPALAISKDQHHGAVLIDPDKCIGCKYCSWVCPYDAPTFNYHKMIMEKCTFCSHRLEEELPPACVALCPTNALQINDYHDTLINDPVPGFTQSDIKPAINLIALRENQQIPEMAALPYDDKTIQLFRKSLSEDKKEEKISFLADWPLVIFSVLLAFIAGTSVVDILHYQGYSYYLPLILSIFALSISSFHLGKKIKAPRALLNLKNSWLSREIAFFILFIVLISIHKFLLSEATWLAWLAVVSVFISAFSLDKVYTVIATVEKIPFHSANTFLTGLFFAAIFSNYEFGIFIFGGIKLLLYIRQFLNRLDRIKIMNTILALVRLGFGFIFPLIIWYWEVTVSWTIVVILILIAELIDRGEFYEQLKTITPAKQMVIDLDDLAKKVLGIAV